MDVAGCVVLFFRCTVSSFSDAFSRLQLNQSFNSSSVPSSSVSLSTSTSNNGSQQTDGTSYQQQQSRETNQTAQLHTEQQHQQPQQTNHIHSNNTQNQEQQIEGGNQTQDQSRGQQYYTDPAHYHANGTTNFPTTSSPSLYSLYPSTSPSAAGSIPFSSPPSSNFSVASFGVSGVPMSLPTHNGHAVHSSNVQGMSSNVGMNVPSAVSTIPYPTKVSSINSFNNIVVKFLPNDLTQVRL